MAQENAGVKYVTTGVYEHVAPMPMETVDALIVEEETPEVDIPLFAVNATTFQKL